jgi:hypothetical protein
MFCAACGGVLMFLGQLGRLLHFKCRACGLPQSFDKATVDFEVEDEVTV